MKKKETKKNTIILRNVCKKKNFLKKIKQNLEITKFAIFHIISNLTITSLSSSFHKICPTYKKKKKKTIPQEKNKTFICANRFCD